MASKKNKKKSKASYVSKNESVNASQSIDNINQDKEVEIEQDKRVELDLDKEVELELDDSIAEKNSSVSAEEDRILEIKKEEELSNAIHKQKEMEKRQSIINAEEEKFQNKKYSASIVKLGYNFEDNNDSMWDSNDKTGVVFGGVLYPERVKRLVGAGKNRYNFLKNTIMRFEGIKDVFFKECEGYIFNDQMILVIDIVDSGIRIFSRYPEGFFPPSSILIENTFSKVLPFRSAVIVKNDKHLNYAVRYIMKVLENEKAKPKRFGVKVDYHKRLLTRGVLPNQMP